MNLKVCRSKKIKLFRGELLREAALKPFQGDHF